MPVVYGVYLVDDLVHALLELSGKVLKAPQALVLSNVITRKEKDPNFL